MREGRTSARFRHAALPYDDRMARGGFAKAFEETATIAYTLDVHPEHTRRGVFGHNIDIVRCFQHQHVANRGCLVDANSPLWRLRAEVDRVGAALRDKTDVAGLAS